MSEKRQSEAVDLSEDPRDTCDLCLSDVVYISYLQSLTVVFILDFNTW